MVEAHNNPGNQRETKWPVSLAAKRAGGWGILPQPPVYLSGAGASMSNTGIQTVIVGPGITISGESASSAIFGPNRQPGHSDAELRRPDDRQSTG